MTNETAWRGVGFGLMLAIAGGCGPGGSTTDMQASTGDDTTGGSDPTTPTSGATDPTDPTDPTDTTGGPDGNLVALGFNRDVDLLFVIDNSGSMAEEQGLLAQNIAALVNVFEAVGANYRVGVTTTDSGNPRCPSATYKPEGGNLVLSSCLDRIDQGEFIFGADDFSFACTDVCTKRDADLVVKGTATAYDPQEMPRKWVEAGGGQSNIGGVGSVAEALQCYLPQGVAGCGFESHLESMYLALANSASQASKNNYGFLREAAQTAIVIVSDETDCSYNPGTQEIFTVNKVFWNSPDDPAPTSGMCWRAGVECSGPGPSYSECHAQNYGAQGSVTADPSEAVLQPVSKYIDFVKSIEAQKQQIDEGLRVQVALLAGVPVGYENFEAEIAYEDSPDADYQASFGIGPGCVLGDPGQPSGTATPPVREREFAEAFLDVDHRNLYSICQNDYSGALAAIAGQIADTLRPTCMPTCVKDIDPATPVVDPSCQLYEENIVQGTQTEIPQCMEVNGEWTAPPGATVCFGIRRDRDGKQTPSMLDDMSPYCIDEGFNLEFELVRSAAAPAGVTYSGVCEPSDNKQKDCPNL